MWMRFYYIVFVFFCARVVAASQKEINIVSSNGLRCQRIPGRRKDFRDSRVVNHIMILSLFTEQID